LSTAKKFAGETAIYGLSTIVPRLLSSLLTPLYTRAYLPKVYSIFNTMFSYASILQSLLAFGMETTFFRFLNKFPEKKKQVYNNGFWVIFFVSVIFLLTTVPFTHTLAGLIRIGNDTPTSEFQLYIRLFIGVLILDAWCVIPFAKLRAEGRPMKYGVIKLINIVVTILLNVIFLFGIPWWINHDYYGTRWLTGWYVHGWVAYVFLSNLIASFVTLLILLPELLQLQLTFDKTMFKGMLIYSSPILIANLSYLVNENLDKILLGKMLPAGVSEHEVGVYSACAGCLFFSASSTRPSAWGPNLFFSAMRKTRMPARPTPASWTILSLPCA
jgi:O-antigen/teichoic acid export membrane protein